MKLGAFVIKFEGLQNRIKNVPLFFQQKEIKQLTSLKILTTGLSGSKKPDFYTKLAID